MTTDPFAPLGRFIDDPDRACTYSPGDTPAADCGVPATWHLMWNVEAEVSFACDPHMDRARRRFVFVDSHQLGPDCGMPGALWDLSEKRCVYPGEPSTAAEISQSEPVVSVHGARELSPEVREAVEALIAVAKQQISEPAADTADPSVAELAANDRNWDIDRAGEK